MCICRYGAQYSAQYGAQYGAQYSAQYSGQLLTAPSPSTSAFTHLPRCLSESATQARITCLCAVEPELPALKTLKPAPKNPPGAAAKKVEQAAPVSANRPMSSKGPPKV